MPALLAGGQEPTLPPIRALAARATTAGMARSIVILDAAYSPATPADLVEELRTLAESATFELP
jgi:hypothetical protein